MNYPAWAVPAPGLLIALVAIVHVFISHFAVGGGLFLVVAERKARRDGDAALLRFVRGLSRGFVLLTVVAGALTGVGIWITIGLVQPQATSALVHAFVWAWATEWTFFALEIAAALIYLYGWDRLDRRRHEAVGWIYALSSWGSLVVISGILAFMLTSGGWPETHRFADGFFNPTFLPMVAVRTAIAGFLAGLYALLAASFLRDTELKARIARWSATRWIAPAALATVVAVVWFLAAAAGANVEIAETLGAPAASLLARGVRCLCAEQRRPPDRAHRGTGRHRLGRGADARGVGARAAARPPLHAGRSRRADAARSRRAGRRRVGARGPAQTVGDRPLHVRQRRARGRPRDCRRCRPLRPRDARPARRARGRGLGRCARRLPAGRRCFRCAAAGGAGEPRE